MVILNYLRTDNISDAYEALMNDGAVILGGGAFLHLNKSDIKLAIDLSNLNLDFIKDTGDEIEIGAYVTLEQILLNIKLQEYCGGIIYETLKNTANLQIRNTATIGGTVAGKYGFSDVLTSLLALDAIVDLYKQGRVFLEEYVEGKFDKDIITKIILKKRSGKAVFKSLRISSTDFSVLNTAVLYTDGKFRISVGARPYYAVLAYDSMKYLNVNGVNDESIEMASNLASEEIEFGNDLKGSAWYRKQLCKVLVKRGIMEAIL